VIRHQAPEALPLMAEAYTRGVSFKWTPTGLQVFATGPVPTELVSELQERSEEIRAILYTAMVSYEPAPAIVSDPNSDRDFPLTREVWSRTCPADGWPASSHSHEGVDS
jgi:hypothetical protein